MLKLPRAARLIQTAAVTDEDPIAALARLEAQIAALTEARAKLQRAAGLEAEARRLRAEVAVPGANSEEPLSSVNIPSRVNTNMVSVHRVAISKGRSRRNDAFIAHIGNHKPKAYTLRSLAEALNISSSTLHAHRKPKGEPNSRPCPVERAETVKRLTGWPADAAHWPAGLS